MLIIGFVFHSDTERSGSRAWSTGGTRWGHSHKDAGTAEDGVLLVEINVVILMFISDLMLNHNQICF